MDIVIFFLLTVLFFVTIIIIDQDRVGNDLKLALPPASGVIFF